MRLSKSNRLAILAYHSLDSSGSVVSVAPGDFANQMACLSDNGFRAISLSEAVIERVRKGSWPERAVVLTFDDGFANFYDEALPVLIRYGFTATVFVISSHMGGRNDWGPCPKDLGIVPMLSWQQAAEISSAGIEIGSHTQTHRDLRHCSAEEARQEITSSRADIEDRLGFRVQSFAYPYGGHNQISRELVAENFRASCTTELRRANEDPLHLLPRLDMYYLRSGRRFARLLNGHLDPYLTLRRWGRRARRVFISDSVTGQPPHPIGQFSIASDRVQGRQKDIL